MDAAVGLVGSALAGDAVAYWRLPCFQTGVFKSLEFIKTQRAACDGWLNDMCGLSWELGCTLF